MTQTPPDSPAATDSETAPPPGRRYKRIPTNVISRIKGVKTRETVVRKLKEHTIKNVSMGGVYVETNDPYDLDTVVDMSFCLPGSPKEIAVKGIVRWRNTKARPFGMGIEFVKLELTDKDNIRNYIKDRIIEEFDSIPELIDCLNDVDSIIRKTALFALKKLTSEDFGSDCAKWQQWYDANKETQEKIKAAEKGAPRKPKK